MTRIRVSDVPDGGDLQAGDELYAVRAGVGQKVAYEPPPDATAEYIKTQLESLGPGDRLDASFIDNLPTPQGGGLALVVSDNTLSGSGTQASPLRVAIPYTGADQAKLAGIETGAQVNVGEEYTQGEKTKLGGVETAATADQTAAEIRDALQSLTGDDQLSGNFIKDLPMGGGPTLTDTQVMAKAHTAMVRLRSSGTENLTPDAQNRIYATSANIASGAWWRDNEILHGWIQDEGASLPGLPSGQNFFLLTVKDAVGDIHQWAFPDSTNHHFERRWNSNTNPGDFGRLLETLTGTANPTAAIGTTGSIYVKTGVDPVEIHIKDGSTWSMLQAGSGGGGAGLTQSQVDARIDAKVPAVFQSGNTDEIGAAKLPLATSSTKGAITHALYTRLTGLNDAGVRAKSATIGVSLHQGSTENLTPNSQNRIFGTAANFASGAWWRDNEILHGWTMIEGHNLDGDLHAFTNVSQSVYMLLTVKDVYGDIIQWAFPDSNDHPVGSSYARRFAFNANPDDFQVLLDSFTGVNAPASSLGVSGSIYVQTDTSTPSLYLKRGSSWHQLHTFTQAQSQKLAGIEAMAQRNVGEEFTTALQTKLNAIEANATADQTGAEIVTALEALPLGSRLSYTALDDIPPGGGGGGGSGGLTAVFSDATLTGTGTSSDVLGVASPFTAAEKTKLGGIETAATADQTGAEIVTALEALGSGSRLSYNRLDDLPNLTNLLSSVSSDSTLTGAGTSSNTLKVANPFTAAEKTKLGGIETGAQVNVGVEYTQAEKTKLAGVAAGAQANVGVEYTQGEKTKLASVATGAEVNVQSDWDAVSGDAQILNKPDIPDVSNLLSTVSTGSTISGTGVSGSPLDVVNPFTDADEAKLDGIAAGAEVNVQADWSQSTDTADDYIKNKPIIPSITGLLSSVSTDATITGDGASNPLSVATPFTSGEKTKLAGVEAGATADQTAAEIRDALSTLMLDDRLDAIHIKGITPGGSGGTALVRETLVEQTITSGTLTSLGSNGTMTAFPSSFNLSRALTADDDGKLMIVLWRMAGANNDYNGAWIAATFYAGEFRARAAVTAGNYNNISADAFNVSGISGTGGGAFRRAVLLKFGDQQFGATSLNSTNNYIAGLKVYLQPVAGVKGDTGATGPAGPAANVSTDSTLTGNGSAGNVLSVANPYSAAEKAKLGGIATGAEVNVQVDWNQATTTADDYIKNKPNIPSITGLLSSVNSDSTLSGSGTSGSALSVANPFTAAEKTKLSGIATGAEVNVQSDWDATSGDAAILNKPNIPDTSNFITAVTSDATLTGDGANTALRVANPFTAADEAKLDNIAAGANVGLTAVSSDSTLTGAGTSSNTLKVANPFTAADETKLDGIEAGAQVNVGVEYTQAEKTKLAGVTAGAQPNVGVEFTAAEKTKLGGIEANAEVNVGEEYTSTEKTKLAGIEAGATTDQTGAEIKTALEALAQGSRLNAQYIDGLPTGGGVTPGTALARETLVDNIITTGSNASVSASNTVRALGTTFNFSRALTADDDGKLLKIFIKMSPGSSDRRGVWNAVEVYGSQWRNATDTAAGTAITSISGTALALNNWTMTTNEGHWRRIALVKVGAQSIGFVGIQGGTSYISGVQVYLQPVAGVQGPAGAAGAAGAGVPTGGTSGQILAKASNTDRDTHWINAPTGGGGGLATVASDATLTGTGASGSPLAVANPFTDADETKLDGIAAGAVNGGYVEDELRPINTALLEDGGVIWTGTFKEASLTRGGRGLELPPFNGNTAGSVDSDTTDVPIAQLTGRSSDGPRAVNAFFWHDDDINLSLGSDGGTGLASHFHSDLRIGLVINGDKVWDAAMSDATASGAGGGDTRFEWTLATDPFPSATGREFRLLFYRANASRGLKDLYNHHDLTPEEIRDDLAGLTGDNRLSYNALKDLPTGPNSGGSSGVTETLIGSGNIGGTYTLNHITATAWQSYDFIRVVVENAVSSESDTHYGKISSPLISSEQMNDTTAYASGGQPRHTGIHIAVASLVGGDTGGSVRPITIGRAEVTSGQGADPNTLSVASQATGSSEDSLNRVKIYGINVGSGGGSSSGGGSGGDIGVTSTLIGSYERTGTDDYDAEQAREIQATAWASYDFIRFRVSQSDQIDSYSPLYSIPRIQDVGAWPGADENIAFNNSPSTGNARTLEFPFGPGARHLDIARHYDGSAVDDDNLIFQSNTDRNNTGSVYVYGVNLTGGGGGTSDHGHSGTLDAQEESDLRLVREQLRKEGWILASKQGFDAGSGSISLNGTDTAVTGISLANPPNAFGSFYGADTHYLPDLAVQREDVSTSTGSTQIRIIDVATDATKLYVSVTDVAERQALQGNWVDHLHMYVIDGDTGEKKLDLLAEHFDAVESGNNATQRHWSINHGGFQFVSGTRYYWGWYVAPEANFRHTAEQILNDGRFLLTNKNEQEISFYRWHGDSTPSGKPHVVPARPDRFFEQVGWTGTIASGDRWYSLDALLAIPRQSHESLWVMTSPCEFDGATGNMRLKGTKWVRHKSPDTAVVDH